MREIVSPLKVAFGWWEKPGVNELNLPDARRFASSCYLRVIAVVGAVAVAGMAEEDMEGEW